MADFYNVLGVARDRVRRRHQEGVSQARDDSTTPTATTGRRKPRRSSRRSPRRTTCCAIRRSAPRTIATARPGSRGGSGGGLPPRRPVRSAQHLHARLRRLRRARRPVRARPAARAATRAGSDVKLTVPLTLAEVATGVREDGHAQAARPVRPVRGQRRRAGHEGAALHHVRRPGRGAARAALVLRAVRERRAVPDVHGEGTGHRSRRARSAAARDACAASRRSRSQIPAGRRDRAVHDAARRRQRGAARRPARRRARGLRGRGRSALRARRRGPLCEVLVTYPQLVLGADVEVPTVTRERRAARPAGTQSGQVFHLRGRGLPRVNASGIGDLHVRVQLWTPESSCAGGGAAASSELAEMQQARARPTRQGLLGEDEGSAGRVSWLGRCAVQRRAARATRALAALFGPARRACRRTATTLVTHFPDDADARARRRARCCGADPRRRRRTSHVARRSTGPRRGRRASARTTLGALAIVPPWLADGRDPARTIVIDPGWRSAPASTRRRAASCGCCSASSVRATASPTSARAARCSRSPRRSSAPRTSPPSRSIPTPSRTPSENVARNGVARARDGHRGRRRACCCRSSRRCDVVLANIISSVLLELLPAIATRSPPDGEAILSGILRRGARHDARTRSLDGRLASRRRGRRGRLVEARDRARRSDLLRAGRTRPGRVGTLGEDAAHHMRVQRLDVGDPVRLTERRRSCARTARSSRSASGRLEVDCEHVERRADARSASVVLWAPVADRDRMLLARREGGRARRDGWRPVRVSTLAQRDAARRGRCVPREASRAHDRRARAGRRRVASRRIEPEAPLDARRDLRRRARARLVLDPSARRSSTSLPTCTTPRRHRASAPRAGSSPTSAPRFDGRGFRAASLGANVLRFETAGIAGARARSRHAAAASRCHDGRRLPLLPHRAQRDPGEVVHEDEHCVAFRDIDPQGADARARDPARARRHR